MYIFKSTERFTDAAKTFQAKNLAEMLVLFLYSITDEDDASLIIEDRCIAAIREGKNIYLQITYPRIDMLIEHNIGANETCYHISYRIHTFAGKTTLQLYPVDRMSKAVNLFFSHVDYPFCNKKSLPDVLSLPLSPLVLSKPLVHIILNKPIKVNKNALYDTDHLSLLESRVCFIVEDTGILFTSYYKPTGKAVYVLGVPEAINFYGEIFYITNYYIVDNKIKQLKYTDTRDLGYILLTSQVFELVHLSVPIKEGSIESFTSVEKTLLGIPVDDLGIDTHYGVDTMYITSHNCTRECYSINFLAINDYSTDFTINAAILEESVKENKSFITKFLYYKLSPTNTDINWLMTFRNHNAFFDLESNSALRRSINIFNLRRIIVADMTLTEYLSRLRLYDVLVAEHSARRLVLYTLYSSVTPVTRHFCKAGCYLKITSNFKDTGEHIGTIAEVVPSEGDRYDIDNMLSRTYAIYTGRVSTSIPIYIYNYLGCK